MNVETALVERALWLALSIIMAAFAIAVRWILEQPNSRFSEQFRTWETSPQGRWTIHSLRLLYAVGVPVIILFWRGTLTERGLGLQPIQWFNTQQTIAQENWEDWVLDLGWSFGIGASTWLILMLGKQTVQRTTEQQIHSSHHLGITIREAIYHQVHWAFYREPFVLLWGPALGAWIGLIPVIIEAIINPQRWKALNTPGVNLMLIARAGLAIASALLYM